MREDAGEDGGPAAETRQDGDPASAADTPVRSPGAARSADACFGLVFPGHADDPALDDYDPDDLIPVTGFGTADTVHLSRAFLEHLLAAATGATGPPGLTRQVPFTPAKFRVTRDVIGCHDDTGAYLTGTTGLTHWLDLIDPTAQPPPPTPRTDAYRPTTAIRRLLTARDGRCRFPHCHNSARFADVDHVVAWPAGTTDLAGLALLCRRHHRIKQRHRWHVRIRADATLEWVTPTGHVRITHPIDHLEPARQPVAADMVGNGNDEPSGISRFGDPILPPTPPAQQLPALPPRPQPSTGHHPDGDFGWLRHLYASTTKAQGRGRRPIVIRYAELERCTARRHAAQAAAEAERLAAHRAAERAARDAEPPPF